MKNANETDFMMQKEKNGNGIKTFSCRLKRQKSGGLFLFSFFEPKCLLEAIPRLAYNTLYTTLLPPKKQPFCF